MKYSPWFSCGDEKPVNADEEGVEAEPQHGHGAPVEVPRPEIELKHETWSIWQFDNWSTNHLGDVVEAHQHYWGEDQDRRRDE